MHPRSGHINPLAKHLTHKKKIQVNVHQWLPQLKKGNIPILAQAITLIESRKPSDRTMAIKLLSGCTVKSNATVRLGITGPPGVGKSSFIENIGQALIVDTPHKLAVLTIDPTSPVQGGSILGDKTRMQTLAALPNVYIRPSPSGHDESGGIHLRTRETIQLLEYAGFDYILVETVGVGQSEYSVKDITDFTILLIAPGGGDELQGIKRGITEIADLIVVTKDDSGMEAAAKAIQVQYQNALRLLHGKGENAHHTGNMVLKCSNVSNSGMSQIVQLLKSMISDARKAGTFVRKRKAQKKNTLHAMIANAWRQEWLMRKTDQDLQNIEGKSIDPSISLENLAQMYIKRLKTKINKS